jgi:tRNA nucleotidyltransferase (CCA-adding enzyme)
LPVKLKKDIISACELWRDQETLPLKPPSAVVSWQRDVPLLARYAMYKATSDPQLKEVSWLYVAQWQDVEPVLDGNDLKSHGIPPGPVYRQILDSLRNAWLDGRVTSASEESDYLEKILQELPN